MERPFAHLGRTLPQCDVVRLRRELITKLSGHFHSERTDAVPVACRICAQTVSSGLDASWFDATSRAVLYMENYDEMLLVDVAEAIKFFSNREPWEDYDACLFDEQMSWCAALTHNGEAKFLRF